MYKHFNLRVYIYTHIHIYMYSLKMLSMKFIQISYFISLVTFIGVVLSHSQSYLTPCDLMGYSPPGSSVHGISQARKLEWVANSSSKGFF